MVHGGYQMRRSPFVQRQMAKGKRFDRRRGTLTGAPSTPFEQADAAVNKSSEVEMVAAERNTFVRSKTERRPQQANPALSQRAFGTEQPGLSASARQKARGPEERKHGDPNVHIQTKSSSSGSGSDPDNFRRGLLP